MENPIIITVKVTYSPSKLLMPELKDSYLALKQDLLEGFRLPLPKTRNVKFDYQRRTFEFFWVQPAGSILHRDVKLRTEDSPETRQIWKKRLIINVSYDERPYLGDPMADPSARPTNQSSRAYRTYIPQSGNKPMLLSRVGPSPQNEVVVKIEEQAEDFIQSAIHSQSHPSRLGPSLGSFPPGEGFSPPALSNRLSETAHPKFGDPSSSSSFADMIPPPLALVNTSVSGSVPRFRSSKITFPPSRQPLPPPISLKVEVDADMDISPPGSSSLPAVPPPTTSTSSVLQMDSQEQLSAQALPEAPSEAIMANPNGVLAPGESSTSQEGALRVAAAVSECSSPPGLWNWQHRSGSRSPPHLELEDILPAQLASASQPTAMAIPLRDIPATNGDRPSNGSTRSSSSSPLRRRASPRPPPSYSYSHTQDVDSPKRRLSRARQNGHPYRRPPNPADLPEINKLTRELWDIRREMSANVAKAHSVQKKLLDMDAPNVEDPDDLEGLTEQALKARLEQLQHALASERRLRMEAERALKDVRQECRAPFVVPSLLDAFVAVSKLSAKALQA